MSHRFSNRVCFICGAYREIEKHHIFGGANRNKSEADGLTVYLCAGCHRHAPWSAHQSARTAQLLHAFGEMMWLGDKPERTIADFRYRYGRNYLRDYEERDRR